MADLTRANNAFQKRGVCYLATVIEEGTDDGDLPLGTANHQIANLPADSLITDAYVFVLTAGDAATSAAATLGTASGGTELASGVDLKTLGDQGTFTGISNTGTGVTVWLNVTKTGAETAVGKYLVVVEYLEYNKNTGEYTAI